MSTAVISRLSVYKRINKFIKTGSMGKNKFKIFALITEQLVQRILCAVHFPHNQILQPLFTKKNVSVAVDFQTWIQVSIIPQTFFNHFHVKIIFTEHFSIRNKFKISAVLYARLCIPNMSRFFNTPLVFHNSHFSVADTCSTEIRRKRVCSLNTNTVHTNSLLKNRIIVFCASIYVANTLLQLSQRNTTPIVANLYMSIFDFNINFVAITLGKFVNRVINAFL